MTRRSSCGGPLKKARKITKLLTGRKALAGGPKGAEAIVKRMLNSGVGAFLEVEHLLTCASNRHRQGAKRQRTSSPSPDINSKQSNPASPAASDDESKSRTNANGNRKHRAASRGQRDKDVKEPDDQEAEQAEAASRRKGRGDRRKGEGMF